MRTEFKRYLDKYGPDKDYKIETSAYKCRYAIVVPSIAEFENIKSFLDSFLKIERDHFKETLLLFVINNGENSPDVVKEDNQKSLYYLRAFIEADKCGLNIGVLDASSDQKAFPEKDAGVGLARKTGMDAVLSFFKDEGKNIIICTDADCRFEKNYLNEIVSTFNNKDSDAAVINFRHLFDEPETAEAVVCYEIFLRYYVLGLKFASSPFSFHTIGSSMACTPEAYVNIEGMNKRKAAEDFYFLEKLAKKYNIEKIRSTIVYPSSRKSWRVPFGTGQRMNRHLANERDEYLLVNPDAYKILGDWNSLFLDNEIFNASYYLEQAGRIGPELTTFLKSQGFNNDWDNIVRNNKKVSGILRKKIQWFDGFRTLKLIHYLRDNKTGQLSMFDALDQFFIMTGIENSITRKTSIPDLQTQKQYLDLLRKLDN